MNDDTIKEVFLHSAEGWICDGYSLDIRFMAKRLGEEWHLWNAHLSLHPLPALNDHNLMLEIGDIVVGQLQINSQKRATLLALLQGAASGSLESHGKKFILFDKNEFTYYSEMTHRDRWFSDLHLQIGSSTSPAVSPSDWISFDNALR
ncbi:MAG: hypothetical protein ACREGC_03925, partial [Minisyncoccia bacterium]